MAKRRKLILGIVMAVALLAILAWSCCGYLPGTLHFDEQGEPHGTGVKKYFYTSGSLQLEDQYLNGKLSKSIWFKPDGTILATTKWQKGSGTAYYLNNDGSIRVKIEYVDGLANGRATYYKHDGSVDRHVEFRNGIEAGP